MSTLTEPFVLPTDLVLVEPGSLPPSLRDAVGEDEVALTRPRGRSTSGVVDRSIADLLEEFREPRTIVDAVLRFARARDLDPEQALADTYPALRRCLGERFLVPADGERTIEPLSKPGDLVGDATVLSCIQVLEDVELHRGELADGTAVAIKVVRSTRARGSATTAREAALLTHLAGDPSPRLLSSGDLDGRQYLVIEWREGLPVTSAAQLADDAGRLELARAVVAAYERLHSRGVVHGDVHPGNTVVGPDGVVTLLDLGLARRIDGGEPARAPRGGILSYLDPEYAAGQRAGHAPQATVASELFSVATLVYEVLARKHRMDLGVDESEALRRLAEDEAEVAPALGAYGPVAHVVQAMVGLDAAARPSLGDLATALDSVATPAAVPAVPASVSPRPDASGLDRLVDRVVARLGADGPMLDAGLPAPTASVFYGAAGIAYGLLRIAIAREDADLLEAARLWCDRALIEAGRPEGFVAPELQIDESITGLTTPYHRESGVHLVRALVAYAAGDLMTAANAAVDFVSSSRPLVGAPELTLGLSGTVLGAAMLIDALDVDSELDLSMVRALGDEALDAAWRDLDLLGPVAAGSLVQPGLAHGWAGVALAALRWRRSTGAALPSRLVGKARRTCRSCSSSRPGIGLAVGDRPSSLRTAADDDRLVQRQRGLCPALVWRPLRIVAATAGCPSPSAPGSPSSMLRPTPACSAAVPVARRTRCSPCTAQRMTTAGAARQRSWPPAPPLARPSAPLTSATASSRASSASPSSPRSSPTRAGRRCRSSTLPDPLVEVRAKRASKPANRLQTQWFRGSGASRHSHLNQRTHGWWSWT